MGGDFADSEILEIEAAARVAFSFVRGHGHEQFSLKITG
jgi:hypothetical protein